MTEIVGACLSQFHDDANCFELLLAYADGREVGHLVSRAAALRIAVEFANEFGDTQPPAPSVELIEDLRLAASSIRQWMPETLPANEQGQIHFARLLAESAAEAIEAFLAVTNHGSKSDLHPEYVTSDDGTKSGYKSDLYPGNVPSGGDA